MLQATVLAVADELAGAAELVMGKLDGVPVAIVRGYAYTRLLVPPASSCATPTRTSSGSPDQETRWHGAGGAGS